jgi:hypothetical protein
MLKEDYLMRLFQQFNESLSKWLSKKNENSYELIITFNDELVKPFLDNDFIFFEQKNIEELIVYFQNKYNNEYERLAAFGILAELFYQRAFLCQDVSERDHFLTIVLGLLSHQSSVDKVFSIQREDRMREIREQILQ